MTVLLYTYHHFCHSIVTLYAQNLHSSSSAPYKTVSTHLKHSMLDLHMNEASLPKVELSIYSEKRRLTIYMYNKMMFMEEELSVLIRKRSLHIKNTESLRRVLKKRTAPLRLARYLKQVHTDKYDTALNISDESLTIEIIGHVYIGNFADILKAIPRIPKIAPIIVERAYRITDHTDIIDCGEKEVDSNRWVWDKLAILYDAIMNNMYELLQENNKKS